MAKNPKPYRKRKRGYLSQRETESFVKFAEVCIEYMHSMTAFQKAVLAAQFQMQNNKEKK